MIKNTEKAHPESNFISTSTEKNIAELFAEMNYEATGKPLQYIYEITDNGKGIDVNEYFNIRGLESPYPWQKEVSFKNKIPIENIKGVYIMRSRKVISNRIGMKLFNKK